MFHQQQTVTPNVYPLIALAVNTGMRRGELAALQVQDVDLDNNTITIQYSIMEIKGKCYLDTTKTEASQRTIYISEQMTEILRQHIDKSCKGKYLFPNLRDANKPQAPGNISRFYTEVVKLAGLNGGIHITRHTQVTQLLEQGVNLKSIMARVGHSQVSTTMGYAHPDKKIDQQAAKLFDKFM